MEGLVVSAGLGFEEASENLAGLIHPASVGLVFDLLLGEPNCVGSTFSESQVSSKEEEARRLPVEGVEVGFSGEKVPAGGVLPGEGTRLVQFS
jgi:hypothetical protein